MSAFTPSRCAHSRSASARSLDNLVQTRGRVAFYKGKACWFIRSRLFSLLKQTGSRVLDTCGAFGSNPPRVSTEGEAVPPTLACFVTAIRTIEWLAAGLQEADGLPGEIQMGVNHHAIAVIAGVGLCCPFQ